MSGLLADNIEMGGKSRLRNHVGGVAANQHRLVDFKTMMVIEIEKDRAFSDAATVIGDLAEVLAFVFEFDLEGAHGFGSETDHADFCIEFGIVNGQYAARNDARILASDIG